MLLHVFRMRSSGHRLPSSDPGLRRGVAGMLTYKQSPLDDHGPRWEAHLINPESGKALLLPLYWARLKRIEGGIIHLAGIEEGGRQNTKAKPMRYKQSWLCALNPADALPLLAKVHVTSVSGFDPEDDNAEDDDALHLIARQ